MSIQDEPSMHDWTHPHQPMMRRRMESIVIQLEVQVRGVAQIENGHKPAGRARD